MIDWVMKKEGVSFRHAVDLLKNNQLPSLAAETNIKTKPESHSTPPKLDAALLTTADEQALLTRVIDFYHEPLKQSSEALAYLESRGLHDDIIYYF